MSAYYIGVMSGTSLDGVDVVLCEITTTTCKLHTAYEHPFAPELKAAILHTIANPTTLQDIGILNHRLGHLFADAITTLLARSPVSTKEIRAIGLHGQTLWHEPHGNYPFSMQLGDATIVAVETGIDVVCDFRSTDVALGGQGAPFAPAFHQFMFHKVSPSTCIVNIGGMANITVLGEPLLGYDTGPGNVLMDLWIAQHRHTPYDKEGLWAQGGTVNTVLLERFLQDPYFSQSAPKSTGREHFNAQWLHDRLSHLHVNAQDVQATLLELTVQSIVDEVGKRPCELLLVCGGGVHNSFLMQRLNETLPKTQVSPTDAYGVSSTFMEAMAFAWLAYKRINKEAVPLNEVTGARNNAILGGVYAGH